MATDSHVKSVTNTLTSTTADEITLTQLWPVVRITNHSTSTWLYARQDGVAVAEANGTTAIAPNTTRAVKGERAEGTNTIVVSVVGDGNTYTVEGINGGEINLTELQADVAALENATSSVAPSARSGFYYSTPGGRSTASRPSGFLNIHPVELPAGTYDRLSIEVTSAAASSTVRLGIYDDDGGFPGSLIVETADLDTTTTGIKAATINESLAGGLYWLAVNPRGGAPATRALTGHVKHAPGHSTNFSFALGWASGFGPTSGSLPATGGDITSPSAADTMMVASIRRA